MNLQYDEEKQFQNEISRRTKIRNKLKANINSNNNEPKYNVHCIHEKFISYLWTEPELTSYILLLIRFIKKQHKLKNKNISNNKRIKRLLHLYKMMLGICSNKHKYIYKNGKLMLVLNLSKSRLCMNYMGAYVFFPRQ